MTTDDKTLPGATPDEPTKSGATPEQPEQVAGDGLKKALESERKLRRDAEQRLKSLESERTAREQQALEEAGKYTEAKASYEKRLAELEKAKLEAESARERYILRSELSRVAAEFIAPEMLDDALELHGMNAFKLVGGNVEGEKPPKEFFAELIKSKPGYAAKPQAIVIKGVSAGQQAGSQTLTRQQFSVLSPAQKSEFFRKGGKLTD